MAVHTYTQPDGTSQPGNADGDLGGHYYFQHSELHPDTLASGDLLANLDPYTHPKVGITVDEDRGAVVRVIASASALTPVHATSVTLSATVTSPFVDDYPSGTVTFKDGSTTLGTGTLAPTATPGQASASYVDAGGFTAGAHTVTAVYGGDNEDDVATSAAITITAS